MKYQEDIVTTLLYTEGHAPEQIHFNSVIRLHERLFPVILPKPQRRCCDNGILCDTRYFCPQCLSQPGLCIGECFHIYHTYYTISEEYMK